MHKSAFERIVKPAVSESACTPRQPSTTLGSLLFRPSSLWWRRPSTTSASRRRERQGALRSRPVSGLEEEARLLVILCVPLILICVWSSDDGSPVTTAVGHLLPGSLQSTVALATRPQPQAGLLSSGATGAGAPCKHGRELGFQPCLFSVGAIWHLDLSGR
jgi:hypothetical protein